MHYLTYVFYCVISSCIYSSFAKVSVIVWNREGHLFDGVSRAVAFIGAGDTIQIECPSSDNSGSIAVTELSYNQMYENVWKVGRDGYHNCDATNGTLVAKCTDPEQVTRINLDFCPRVAEVMYFISTSNGRRDSLKNVKGGNCQSFNMKLTVYVQ